MKKLLHFLIFILFLLLALVSLFSCKKEEQLSLEGTANAKLYTIQQGNQECDQQRYSPTYKPFNITCEPRFNETCKYVINPADQGDINKIYGVCWGGSGGKLKNGKYIPAQHYDSFRFGESYNPELDHWVLYGYMYNEGVRLNPVPIDTIKLGQFPRMVAWPDYANNQIRIDSYRIDEATGRPIASYHKFIDFKFPANKFGHRLWRYFGGNTTAPHYIEMYIEHN